MSVQHYQLKVQNIIRETEDAIIIEFEHPDEHKLNYKAGQFLTLLPEINGEQVRRAYSLCTSPLVDARPAVTVKRVQGGKVSNHLNDHLEAGQTLEVLEPMGMFTRQYNGTERNHLILLGGGSGITPLMSILKTTLSAEPHSMISLIYANQNQESIIFKDQLEALQQKYPERVRVIHILEKAPLFWSKGYKGRINTKILKKILDKLPQLDPAQTEYFMCGPSGMMKQIEQSFAELNLPLDKLRKESFGVSPEEASETRAEARQDQSQATTEEIVAREVKIIYDGEEHVFTVPPDKTILETAQSLDIDLPYSCQSGMCTACMGKCVSGQVKLDEEDALTPKELEQGFVLTCVGHPLTDDVVIEIE